MNQRKIYAHWLDPDYLGNRVVAADHQELRLQQFQTLLKMYAILGDCILISDVQLVESRVLLLSFADPEFRRFMEQNPSFIQLKAQPDESAGTGHSALAFSGLARIRKQGKAYIPNTFNGRDTVPTIAGFFRNIRSRVDAEKPFTPNGSFTRFMLAYSDLDKLLVVGLYNALKHFAENSKCVEPIARKTEFTYYRELETARDNLSLDQKGERRLIEDVLRSPCAGT